MLKKHAKIAAFVFMAGITTLASASVSTINTQAAFSAAGAISQNTNFDWADHNGFTYLSNPATYGDLTFASGDNLVVGTNTSYHSVRNVLAYDNWSPLPGTVAGTHDLFGFNLGYLGSASKITISLTTNTGSYSFNIANPVLASQGLQFMGFKADAGEYFTSFKLSSAQDVGSAPVITDVQFGVAAVPEPETYAMLLGGLSLIGVARRRRSA